MHVADYMTSDPVVIAETDLLSRAEEVARAKSVHQLPVLDESGRLVGIITDRDIRSAIGYDRTLREKLQVQEVMTQEPITVKPDDTLSHVLKQFCEHRFGAMPVVQSNQLVGIITRHDLLMAMSTMLGLDCNGTDIEVALPDLFKDLVTAFDALSRSEGTLHGAVVARTRDGGDEPSLFLRIGKHDKPEFQKRLRHAGLVLLETEEQHRTKT
ncbi:MAG: CBS domain-containing protein [Phycisphaerae bacterium]|nr:CBS domain-containing protein [Phycisphaerales bacterium]